MEFFRKGGAWVLTQSITLRHILVPQELRKFLCKIESYGHFWELFLKKNILNMAILGVFG